MADDTPKIFVDDDWKEEARREKEKLAEQAVKDQQAAEEAPTEPGVPDLVNLIATQAMAGLGLVQAPGQSPMPPNPPMAKYFIDLLEILAAKTEGNLDDDEKTMLTEVTQQLRMAFVQVVNAMASEGQEPPAQPPAQG